MDKNPGTGSYLMVLMLVAIVGLFGWIGERDYAYQQEIKELNQALSSVNYECGPVMEMSWPVELEIQS